VATDVILQWVSTADGSTGVESAANVVKSNKMKYCMHKNDVVVGVRNGWKNGEIVSIMNKAYPHVISTYSGLTVAAQYFLLRLYNNAKSMREVHKMIYEDLKHRNGYSAQTSDLTISERHQIDCMPQFYFQGVALGIAYAHPDSGDTVATVMIGGLRTVLNGHFTVNSGQLVQWYFDFEASAFDSNGERLLQGNDALPDVIEDGLELLRGHSDNVLSSLNMNTLDRKVWHERESGNFPGYSGKDCVMYLKPYVRNSNGAENILDRDRVCGIFIASARPFEQVDIKMQRQSA
jgi:hypothetical protein